MKYSIIGIVLLALVLGGLFIATGGDLSTGSQSQAPQTQISPTQNPNEGMKTFSIN